MKSPITLFKKTIIILFIVFIAACDSINQKNKREISESPFEKELTQICRDNGYVPVYTKLMDTAFVSEKYYYDFLLKYLLIQAGVQEDGSISMRLNDIDEMVQKIAKIDTLNALLETKNISDHPNITCYFGKTIIKVNSLEDNPHMEGPDSVERFLYFNAFIDSTGGVIDVVYK